MYVFWLIFYYFFFEYLLCPTLSKLFFFLECPTLNATLKIEISFSLFFPFILLYSFHFTHRTTLLICNLKKFIPNKNLMISPLLEQSIYSIIEVLRPNCFYFFFFCLHFVHNGIELRHVRIQSKSLEYRR